MWQFLRDPMWQAIAAAIGLVGIATSIILGAVVYLLQRRRKQLGYRVLARTRVISVEEQVQEEVVIAFRGALVRDVHLVMVELVNSGNQPIVPDDYHRPLRIDLGEGSRVLSVDVAESKPEGIGASPSLAESRGAVEINPVLLNPGDSLRLKMLVSQFSGSVDVSGRVVGVKEIRYLGADGFPRGLAWWAPAALAASASAGVLVQLLFQGAGLLSVMGMVIGSLASGGVAIAAAWLLVRILVHRRQRARERSDIVQDDAGGAR